MAMPTITATTATIMATVTAVSTAPIATVIATTTAAVTKRKKLQPVLQPRTTGPQLALLLHWHGIGQAEWHEKG